MTLLTALGWAALGEASAAPSLVIQPITWNVIGLDSNDQTKGPDLFPVGARVCNVGTTTATGVTSSFFFDGGTTNPYLSLGGVGTVTLDNLPAGGAPPHPNSLQSVPANCRDAYFNVKIQRTAAAFSSRISDTATPAQRNTQLFHITASATDASAQVTTVSTPTPRELYVERILSQGRNSIVTFTGPSSASVGQVITLTLVANTATNGYEQLEDFPVLSNTVFQVLDVTTTYTSTGTQYNSTVYADACGWENNISSSSYHNNLTCIGPSRYGGKVGNQITSTFKVRILAGTASVIHNAIYDYSGSAYHYNSDYDDAGKLFTITTVNPDLTLTKTHTGNFKVGGTASFTFTVSTSADAYGTTTVTDTLPTGLTLPDGPVTLTGAGAGAWSCTSASNKITCTATSADATSNPAIKASTPSTFTVTGINVGAAAAPSVTNTAAVSNPNETVTNNNSASDTATVIAPLTVSKTFTPSTITVGGTTSLAITISNPNSLAASAVTFTDNIAGTMGLATPLPLRVTATTCGGTLSTGGTASMTTGSAVSSTDGTLQLSGGAVPASGSCTVTVDVTVSDSGATTRTNTITAAGVTATVGGQSITAAANATASLTTTLPTTNLTVTKSGPASVNAGQTVTYTLTLTNAGPSAAGGATFSDPVPTSLTGVTATCVNAAGGAAGCAASVGANNAVTGSVSTFPSGASVQITITGTVPAAATGSLSNTATISVPVGVTDTNTADNTSGTVTTTVTPLSDLATDKSVAAAVGSGGTLSYTIRVWNNGPTAATGAAVTDTLPTGFTVTGVTCAATGTSTCGTQTFTASSVTITTGTLNLDTTPGNAVPDGNYLTYTVTGTAATNGTMSNTAAVTAPSGRWDNASGNNSATVTTRVVDAVNDSAVSLAYGAGGTVTVLGNDTIGGVAATTTNGAVTITANGGLSGLSVNASGQLVVPTTAPAGTYTVTYQLCDAGVSTACDTATVPITVGAAGADLSITKTARAYAKPDDAITYTIKVTNNGPGPANSLTLTDVLPDGATFVGASPAATVSGQTLTWTLPTLANAAIWTVTVDAKAPTEQKLTDTMGVGTGTLTNTASVSSATSDPVTTNNSASVSTAVVYGHLDKKVRNVSANGAFGTAAQGVPSEILEYCLNYANYGGVALTNFTLTDHVPGNTTALTTGYDSTVPSPGVGYGIKLVRGAAAATYLTSAQDAADKGSLTTSGGNFQRGVLTVTLDSVPVGETGSVCFRVSIR